MKKKLNNKGLTAVEILVCFVLVSIIIISMMNVVTNYKDKEEQESYKNSITTYKNILTKTIYDDIINNKGVVSASASQVTNPTTVKDDLEQTLNLTFATGKTASIKIHMESRCITIVRESGTRKRLEEKTNQECNEDNDSNIDYEHSKYYVLYTSGSQKEKFSLPPIYNLRFNDIKASAKTDPNSNAETGFIVIHIGLIHTDLGQKYDALNIVTPSIKYYPGVLGNDNT